MKIHRIKMCQKRQYFKYAVQKSQEAMQELNQEAFNSKTLDTLFYNPRFRTTEPNTCMVQSRTTGEPVKVHINSSINTLENKKGKHANYYTVLLSPAVEQEMSLQYTDVQSLLYSPNIIGKKYFSIENKYGKKITHYGSMESNADNLAGIGIREDEIQIKEALAQNIKSIERRSFVNAIWYHLKMGFTPVQKLRRVKSNKDVNTRIFDLTIASPDIPTKNYTPIIVEKKRLLGKRYYFDENTTQAVAALRTVKEKIGNNIRPEKMLDSRLIDMELTGQNLEKWRKIIAGEPTKNNRNFI